MPQRRPKRRKKIAVVTTLNMAKRFVINNSDKGTVQLLHSRKGSRSDNPIVVALAIFTATSESWTQKVSGKTDNSAGQEEVRNSI